MDKEKKDQLIDLLEAKQYDELLLILPKIVDGLDRSDRQGLLELVLDLYFEEKNMLKFIKAFDVIIGSDLDLNFNVDSWGATFLSLVILRAPSNPVFDYFLNKGADINYIGDNLAFEDEKLLDEEGLNNRYETCLDFIELRLVDLLLIDYSYYVPDKKVEGHWSDCENEDKKVALSKKEYLYLHEQSEYLHTLIETDKLKDHIVRLGGKTYKELEKTC